MISKLGLSVIIVGLSTTPSLTFMPPPLSKCSPFTKSRSRALIWRNRQQTIPKVTASDCYMPWELLPPKENWKANSTHRLSRIEVQKAMTKVKRFIEGRLETDLKLFEHTAPIAFATGSGVNDELDGSESKSPVRFVVPNQYVPRGIVPKPESDLNPEERQEAN
eukprot:CAMPEP_0183733326 /NCGR_PEP_ID=MMETSP0737-20130205/40836_1 /TAXON_ID=385413 /ORGANISM="Thalassiosira miniscula, Strain CCMP1093" /LENGTH=163 /DNA_ID=CAMNT_0025966559 /DNA_START=24 /DNA_END=512 /DNA_ORIENTATION=-